MIVGLWVVPALLVGLFSMLRVTTWLERLIASPIAAHPDSLGMARASSVPGLGIGPSTQGRSQPCTSESEHSS